MMQERALVPAVGSSVAGEDQAPRAVQILLTISSQADPTKPSPVLALGPLC